MIDKKIDAMVLTSYLDTLKADAIIEASRTGDDSDWLELTAVSDVIRKVQLFVDHMPDVS
jgi:hypothetical protein